MERGPTPSRRAWRSSARVPRRAPASRCSASSFMGMRGLAFVTAGGETSAARARREPGVLAARAIGCPVYLGL